MVSTLLFGETSLVTVSPEAEHDSEILCCGWCGGGQAALPGTTTREELQASIQISQNFLYLCVVFWFVCLFVS